MREHSSGGVPSVLYDEQYFLHVCEGYQEFLSGEGEYLSRRLAEALAVAGIAPGMRILDVGCGRGEILRSTVELGAQAFGFDYASAAIRLSNKVAKRVAEENGGKIALCQASALTIPFLDNTFDRVLLLDIVEHIYPDELDLTMAEVARVLKPGGRIIVHTAPNVWYDRYAYPLVRFVRTVLGQGDAYPRDPRAIIPANMEVHVNEQSMLSLKRYLQRAKFHHVRVWLSSPPQHRQENFLFRIARWILFNVPPLRWFFEREVFAVGQK